MSILAGAAIMGGASLLSGALGASATRDAARTSARSANRAAELTNQQYMQTRQDLSPYRRVAVGDPIYRYMEDLEDADSINLDMRNREIIGSGRRGRTFDDEGRLIDPATGQPEVIGYTGGALDELSDYGESRVDASAYFEDRGIPEFDFNLEEDPGYQFRKEEQARAIDRVAGGMGNLLSGNRLEEVMARSGDLASQEFGAAYGRGVDRYKMDVGREELLYGREADRYTRDYGREIDYLNRIANLANVGQTATTQTAAAGQTAAGRAGDLISRAGEAQAAGQIGAAQAWGNAIGGVAQAAGMYAMSPSTRYTTDYSIPMISRSY